MDRIFRLTVVSLSKKKKSAALTVARRQLNSSLSREKKADREWKLRRRMDYFSHTLTQISLSTAYNRILYTVCSLWFNRGVLGFFCSRDINNYLF